MNHKNISIIKSFIRIFGFAALIPFTTLGVCLLMIAEVFGVVEELV